MKIERGVPLKGSESASQMAEAQDRRLREAAKLYEQHFIREMVRAMRQATPESGLIETSMGEKIFREQLDHQYVENWVNRGGVGFADLIYNHVKERYMGNSGGQLPRPQGPLPLDSGKAGPIKGKSVGPSAWLLSPEAGTEVSNLDVVAPWSGKVRAAFANGDGSKVIDLHHDQGLVSRIVYMGGMESALSGTLVAAGTRLGRLEGEAPWLHWQVRGGGEVDSTRLHNVVG